MAKTVIPKLNSTDDRLPSSVTTCSLWFWLVPMVALLFKNEVSDVWTPTNSSWALVKLLLAGWEVVSPAAVVVMVGLVPVDDKPVGVL